MMEPLELEENPVAEDAPRKSCWRNGVTHPVARGVLEGWVLVGQATLMAFVFTSTFFPRAIWPDWLYWLQLTLYYSIPLPFVVLCWGNTNWATMRLLFRQFQFKLVAAMGVWLFVVENLFAWQHAEMHFVIWVLINFVFIVPLYTFLFLDGMRQKSKVFRLVYPVLFLVFLCIWYYYFAFHSGKPIVIFNGTDIDPNAPMVTYQGQATNGFSIIIACLATTIWSAVTKFRHEGAIHFPIRVTPHTDAVQVFLNTPPVINAGTWATAPERFPWIV